MRVELPTLLTGFVPERVLNVAVRLTKELLRKHVARVKGDKTLVDSAIQTAWVSTLRHDTCGIPPYKDETQDYTELLLMVVRLSPMLKKAQRRRVQEMIHISVPYPLLLVLVDDQGVHLSALPPGVAVENMISVSLTAPAPELLADLKVPQETPAANLMAVFDRWRCAIHAQRLHLMPPPVMSSYPYRCLSCAQQADFLSQNLRDLTSELLKVVAELKQTRQPQKRISLAKKRRDLADRIILSLS